MKNVDPKLYDLPPRTRLRKSEKGVFVVIDRKSRIVMKDGHRVYEIAKQIRTFEVGKKISVLSNAPICSKTKKFLFQNGIAIKRL